MKRPNKLTGQNAGGPRQLPMLTRWAASVAQYNRFGQHNNYQPMRTTMVTLVLAVQIACGGSHADAVSDPKVLLRVVTAIEESKVEQLASKIYKEGKTESSYHLRTVVYLGTIERAGKSFTLAAAVFIRSRAKGDETPPARGYGFLVCLDPQLRLRSYCRGFVSDCWLDGDKLVRGEKMIADFSAHDTSTRHSGFLVDGDDLLPYPFADRISEADWESGSFKKTP